MSIIVPNIFITIEMFLLIKLVLDLTFNLKSYFAQFANERRSNVSYWYCNRITRRTRAIPRDNISQYLASWG